MSALKLSFIVSFSLAILKFCAGIFTGSLSIAAESIHACIDCSSSILGIAAQKYKYEHFSHFTEAFLLAISASWVLFESFSSSSPVKEPIVAIIVSFINAVVYYWNYSKNKEGEILSLAVKANNVHILSDIGTSLFVFFGLCAYYFTGFIFIEKTIASIIAIWLLFMAIKLIVFEVNH